MIQEQYIEKLRHTLERFKQQVAELEKEYLGNEHKFTYYGGHRLGLLKGKVDAIEDIIDEWETPFYY